MAKQEEGPRGESREEPPDEEVHGGRERKNERTEPIEAAERGEEHS